MPVRSAVFCCFLHKSFISQIENHLKNFQKFVQLEKKKIILIGIIFRGSSGVIDDKPLRFRGELYHPYHFNCTTCGVELNSEAREVRSRPGYAANEMVKLY